jgi:hypothetical protein
MAWALDSVRMDADEWTSTDRPSKKGDWMPLRREHGQITQAVEASSYLLDLTDEDGQPACSRETWDRAVRFLSACARRAWSTTGRKLDPPAILIGPNQSIDLHWRRQSYEMLINVPANPNDLLNYYGDDIDGNSTKGKIASGENQGLVLWLMTRN